MSDFLPSGYTTPKTSGKYMKFLTGDNRFRVLSDKPIIGYEYWTNENRPVRLKDIPSTRPEDMRVREGEHWQTGIKHFWAFAVWDYADEAIKVLEITQTSIQNSLTALFKDKDWGHPSGYDLVVTKTGESLETRYASMAKPHKELDKSIAKEWENTPVFLAALFAAGDPFAAEAVPSVDSF